MIYQGNSSHGPQTSVSAPLYPNGLIGGRIFEGVFSAGNHLCDWKSFLYNRTNTTAAESLSLLRGSPDSVFNRSISPSVEFWHSFFQGTGLLHLGLKFCRHRVIHNIPNYFTVREMSSDGSSFLIVSNFYFFFSSLHSLFRHFIFPKNNCWFH